MSASDAKTTIIRNGTLIDGTGQPAVPNDAVVIQGNRVRSVGAYRGTSMLKIGRTWRPSTLRADG